MTSAAATAEPPSDPGAAVRVAVIGSTRWALWWRDELTDDPRFALLTEGETGKNEPDATVRCEPHGTTIAVPDGPDAEDLPFRPGRFSAEFNAARSALNLSRKRSPDGPCDFTLIEHTQTPLGDLSAHGTAQGRLEARLDELLALSGWRSPSVVHARQQLRGAETTLRAELFDQETSGTALIELVRGAAITWNPGWNVRTPAGGYFNDTLTTREPGAELAARLWGGAETSPLDALHAWVSAGDPWPITAEQTAAVAVLMTQIG
ncbi:MAG: hypothetical protein AAF907_01805 [Planctomycetota bacterium]